MMPHLILQEHLKLLLACNPGTCFTLDSLTVCAEPGGGA
jgi:hypothetical protein